MILNALIPTEVTLDELYLFTENSIAFSKEVNNIEIVTSWRK